MALKFLIDLLSGNLVLVNVPGTVTPPTPHYYFPMFFNNLIPQSGRIEIWQTILQQLQVQALRSAWTK